MSPFMPFVHDDGGRSAAGFKGNARDCVARSIAIASGRPYAEVYAALAGGAGSERKSKGASARNGIRTTRKWFGDYMRSIGAVWTPTMKIGSGCKVHLAAGELPMGRLVVSVSKHYTAVIDGVVHDTFDPNERAATIYHSADIAPPGATRLANGNGWIVEPGPRCVYGYWTLPADGEAGGQK